MFDEDLEWPGLITERLSIRPVMEQDAADIFEILADPDTAAVSGIPCLEGIEDALKSLSGYDTGRAFSIVLGDEVIGLMDIYCDDELLSGTEFMGYYMKKEYRGKGYMTEALSAMRRKWIEEGTEIPMLWIFPDNDGSRRVAEKSGWTFLGYKVVDIDCLNQLVCFYA